MNRFTITSTLSALAFAAALAGCGGSSKSASTTPAEPAAPAEPATPGEAAADSTADAPSGIEQAERGAAVYADACGFCHGDDGAGSGKNPAVVGDGALGSYATAADLLTYVSEEMPADDPGALSQSEYQAVVAYIAQENGVDLTDKSITPDTASAITFGK